MDGFSDLFSALDNEYKLLEQKIKDLENKINSSSSLSAPIAPVKIYPPEYEEYKEINKSLNELKSILKSGGYDPTDYEKQLLQIYDTKYLYNSRRADLEDADVLNYIIDIKKQLYNAFIKLKIKFRL